MKVFKFPIPTEDGVVIVDASIEGKYKFRLKLLFYLVKKKQFIIINIEVYYI